MNRAWFKYKGVNSLDMHLHIENEISFSSPEHDIDFIDVLGRDGDLAIDHKRLKSLNFTIPVTLDLPENMSVNYAATQISSWLKSDVGWFPLEFSGSPEYEYTAICYEQFNIKETLRTYGKTVINFRIQPSKVRKDNRLIEIQNGQTLFNPEDRTAKPVIFVEGTGDIDFYNNGIIWLMLRGVDGEITVNSSMMSVYKNDRPQFDRMVGTLSPLFPQLNSKGNTISWTGNATKVVINPNWKAIT